MCHRFGGAVTDDLRTSSLVLARVAASRTLLDHLLNFDIIAQVNLPPSLPAVYSALFDDIGPLPDSIAPVGNEPVVGVLDSGVLAGHSLPRGWVLDEIDLTDDSTVADLHGHGTQVAGLTVYGDVARCIQTGIWDPRVLVASAKILRRDPLDHGLTIFPENRRPEALVEEAIRHFHQEQGCRVFNLSVCNRDDVYGSGRQFAWAEVLDRLARELDIFIVVAVGNDPDPIMPSSVHPREAFQAGVRDAVLSNPLARVCNPATAAIAIAVGSVARSDLPRTQDSFAGAPRGAPGPVQPNGIQFVVGRVSIFRIDLQRIDLAA